MFRIITPFLFVALVFFFDPSPPLLSAAGEEEYETHFLDCALRVDLRQIGSAEEESFCIEALKEAPFYPGPRDRLLDRRDLGACRFILYDAESGAPLFSRSFCTLFGEWRTTAEARAGVRRSFELSLVMPYPRRDVILSITRREPGKGAKEIFRQRVEMEKRFIADDNPFQGCKTQVLFEHGAPEDHVDLVLLGDGYQDEEMDDFLEDAKDLAEQLFSVSPFKEQKALFNCRAVETPSVDSGVDEPRKGIFKSTVFDTSFNSFDLPRYALSMGIHALHDAASLAPCDFMIVLFNSTRYGGGGLYNLYAVVNGADGGTEGVLAHEFGHLFGGLADEYYTSEVTYIDFYPDGVEPWEPNITALADPKNPKWGALIPPGTPVPTPDEARFERVTGCFEGAGYRAEGLYRPRRDCIMFSCRSGFCPVCEAAILESIRFYTE